MVPSPSTWNPRPSTLDPRQKDRLEKAWLMGMFMRDKKLSCHWGQQQPVILPLFGFTKWSMHERGWEQQQEEVRLRSGSKVWSGFAFGPVGHCFLCCNQSLSAVMWSLRFPFFWSCVCHNTRFITLRTRPVNIDRKQTFDNKTDDGDVSQPRQTGPRVSFSAGKTKFIKQRSFPDRRLFPWEELCLVAALLWPSKTSVIAAERP